MDEASIVRILLLGDPECGKSTFLSRLAQGSDAISLPAVIPIKLLRDLDQPFVYHISMYNRPYRFEFSDTESPLSYSLLDPDLVILCFDVNNRDSLEDLQTNWRKQVYLHYGQREDRLPVMLVGLKRDLRREGPGIIWPQEAYRIAQEMRCDRYAECSAVTGELMREVFEDIARVAAKTTTEAGGQSAGSSCSIM